MPSRSLAVATALCFLLTVGGCISKSSTSQGSSESSSDSSRSISRSASKLSASSSRSSSASSRNEQYQEDVRDYTREFVLSGNDMSTFRRRIGEIAQAHGVTNWERDENTYKGIGRGLKQAGVRGDRLEQLKSALAGPHPDSASWIQSGYDAE